jgi:hypothetical protein
MKTLDFTIPVNDLQRSGFVPFALVLNGSERRTITFLSRLRTVATGVPETPKCTLAGPAREGRARIMSASGVLQLFDRRAYPPQRIPR